MWDPRAWKVSSKKWLHPTSTLGQYKFTPKSEVFPTWAPIPTPKIETRLPKVQALKFILQIEASKLRFSKFQSSTSKSNLRSSFAKFSKTCWKSPKLYKRILAHFENMSLARWFWAFFFEKKVFCVVKWGFSNLSNSRFRSLIAWSLIIFWCVVRCGSLRTHSRNYSKI